MTTLDARPLLPTFLPSVNALLAALSLPFALDHPTDLTPSLLLAIFESLINARLPIPASVRQSRTTDAKARAMLVLLGVLECDVLRGGASSDAEHSIATSNADDSLLAGAGGVSVDGWIDEIGLGEVDPERLAEGGWEETIFVGELLCWLARRKGILPRTRSSRRSSRPRSLYSNHHSYGTEGEGEGNTADFSTSLLLRPSPTPKSQSPRPPSPSPSIDNIDPAADADYSALSHITDVPRHPLVHSPEPSLSVSVTTGTDLSIRARSVSSRTSVSSTHDNRVEFEEASQDSIQIYNPRRMMQDAEEEDDQPPTFRPQCIHELEDPSYIRALAGSSSSFDPSVSREHVFEDENNDDDPNEQDNDDLYAPPTPTPRRVRLTGWIDTVDTTTELSQFATSRSRSQSRAFNTSTGSESRSSRLQSNERTRMSELAKPVSRLITDVSSRSHAGSGKPRRPLASAPLSPPPSLPPLTSSKHLPARSPPSPPPSPPADSDPPFDVSFSTLNNTSTPAKPHRPPRRPQIQSMTTMTGCPPPRRRDRSPSYTPSPPSFSGGSSGTRASSTRSAVSQTRVGATATPTLSPTITKNKNLRSPSPSRPSIKGKSPTPVSPPGSTAMTNTLLTERARLLTELAALKRARAASSTGTIGTGSSNGIVSRRVGVGV